MVTIKRFVFGFLCMLIVFGLLFGARYASLSFLTRDANPYFADLKKIDSHLFEETSSSFIAKVKLYSIYVKILKNKLLL